MTGTSVVLDGVYVKGSIDFRGTGTLTIRNNWVEASGKAWSVITASNADAALQGTDSTIVWPAAVPPPGQNWGNGPSAGIRA